MEKFAFSKKDEVEKRAAELGVKGRIVAKMAKAQASALRSLKKEGQVNPALSKKLSSEVPVFIFEGDTPSDDATFYGAEWCASAARMKLTSDQLDIARRPEIERLDAKVLQLIGMTEEDEE